jgi:hypothetical protein
VIQGKWLVLDRHCEVYDLLAPYADAYFYDFTKYKIVPNSIIVLDGFCKARGELPLRDYIEFVRNLVHTRPDLLFVYCKPSEAGETLEWHVPQIGLGAETLYRKMLVIGGGEMDNRFPCLDYERFLERVWEIKENQENLKIIDKIFSAKDKPYKFLYLSGRAREHRKYLLEKFELEGLLDQSLYSCLEGKPFFDRGINFFHNGEDLLTRERKVKYLPKKYEIEKIQDRVDMETGASFVKYDLFNGEWLDGHIQPDCYIDTYFSVVAETAFYYPYSFRTEKIWKPVMAGHPWIAVTNRGFYKDIRNMGFKTFNQIIDESFDSIENCEERVKRVSQVITDLCKQDLNSFLDAAKDVCYYNQLHMKEVYFKTKKEFPSRFNAFIAQHMRKDI